MGVADSLSPQSKGDGRENREKPPPEGWPLSLVECVQKWYRKCENEMSKDKLDSYLQEKITRAAKQGKLWSTNWLEVPLPEFLIPKQRKVAVFLQLGRLSRGSTRNPTVQGEEEVYLSGLSEEMTECNGQVRPEVLVPDTNEKPSHEPVVTSEPEDLKLGDSFNCRDNETGVSSELVATQCEIENKDKAYSDTIVEINEDFGNEAEASLCSKGILVNNIPEPEPRSKIEFVNSTMGTNRKRSKKRRQRLLSYHQQLVVEKGLPPSRLQVAEASRLKYSGLSSGQGSSFEARTKSNLIQDHTPFKGGHKSFQEKKDIVNDSGFSQGGDWTSSTPNKLHLLSSPQTLVEPVPVPIPLFPVSVPARGWIQVPVVDAFCYGCHQWGDMMNIFVSI